MSRKVLLGCCCAWVLAGGLAHAQGETPPPVAQGEPAPTSPEEEARQLRAEMQRMNERMLRLERAQAEAEAKAEQEADLDEDDALSSALDRVLGRLRLSGYVLGGYTWDRRTSTSLRPLLADHHFFGSDASLYLRAELPADFHAMVQVVFVPRPQDNVYRVDEDVEIERAFVQWSPSALFQVRLGKIVTPVGFWNYLIHDEPLLPTLSVPLPIRRRIFPEEITGLVIEGEAPLGPGRLGYVAWISNGETSVSARDDNHDKAVGGRLYFAADDLGPVGRLQLGLSGYTGRVEQPRNYSPGDPRLRLVAQAEGRGATYFEDVFEAQGYTPWGEARRGGTDRVLAVDLLVDLKGLRLRAESFFNWSRPRGGGGLPRPSEYIEWGAYAYAGYRIELPEVGEGEHRIPLGTLEPFVRYDIYDGNSDFVHELQSLQLFALGFRYELNRHVQLRAEVSRAVYREGRRDHLSVTTGLLLSF